MSQGRGIMIDMGQQRETATQPSLIPPLAAGTSHSRRGRRTGQPEHDKAEFGQGRTGRREQPLPGPRLRDIGLVGIAQARAALAEAAQRAAARAEESRRAGKAA